MLRCLTTKGTSGRGIMGTPYVGLLASELASGGSLPGFLANDVLAGDPVGCRYREEITGWPSTGPFDVAEDGSFYFPVAADGTYSGTTKVYKNGVPDAGTYSFVIGSPSAGSGTTSVSRDFALSYAVAGAVSSVSTDFPISYSIAGSVSADIVLTYAIGAAQPASVTVPAVRTAKFAGRSRVVVFDGSKPVPYPKGPLDELYIIGDFTKDTFEANTTAQSVTQVSGGIVVLEAASLQNGFGVVKLGAMDLAASRMFFTFRVTLANGEQVDRTIELTALDDHKTFFKDPDDRRFYSLDFGADATFGGTTLATVSAPVVSGVTSLMTPAPLGNQVPIKIGGLDLADGATNSFGLWATFANTERIFRTVSFAQEDH